MMIERTPEIEHKEAAPSDGGRTALTNEALDASVYTLAAGHGNARLSVVSSANDSKISLPNNCDEVLKNTAKPNSLDDLSNSSSEQLACLYHEAKPGPVPHGSTDGRPIVFPGSLVGEALSHAGNAIWAGKVFDEHGGLKNRILGQHIISAEVAPGQSWFDGKQSTIVDYKNTSFVAGWIRDEIREVNPGLYLGVAYARYPGGHVPGLFFALDNRHK